MRVKRLEVQGFKSFKDRTVIHFDHSITGIVGPNGCGKSNIVDAFFWVMGEQSYKHMRGDSSEDLIFNGSSKYAALGFAEATMVLETNSPAPGGPPLSQDLTGAQADLTQGTGAVFDDSLPFYLRSKEISVTRRVYRSGEGEYLINGVTARLKDIQELFMDTGVGAKGYSVVEQGQIGKIVNAKPEDRRILIEEAAGIAKYKARKKESLRKIEAAQLNLSRLNDVLQEIERSLNSLERQAQKARLYKKYKGELTEKELTWARRKARMLSEKQATLKKERETLEQELVGLKCELQAVENAIETNRAYQLTDTKLAEEIQSKIQTAAGELTRQQSSLELSRKRQGDLETQLQAMDKEKDEIQSALLDGANKQQLLENELNENNNSFEALSADLAKREEQVQKLRRMVDELSRHSELSQKEMLAVATSASSLNARLLVVQSRLESCGGQSDKLSEQLGELRQKTVLQQNKVSEAKHTLSEGKSRAERVKRDCERAVDGLKAKEIDFSQLEFRREEIYQNLMLLRSRLESLKELDAAHEGFGDGPKAVLDWVKNKERGNDGSGDDSVIMALADVLDIESGFEGVAEGWLAGRIEHLLSESSKLAVRALQKLEADKQGCASIHIRNYTESRESCESCACGPFADVKQRLEAAGLDVLGELSDFVKLKTSLSDPERAIAARALGGVCVLKSFDPMLGLFEQNCIPALDGWSLVALQGQVFECGGILRGGRSSDDLAKTSGIIGRKKEITDLAVEVKNQDAKCLECDEAIQAAKNNIEELRSQLHGLQTELTVLDVRSSIAEQDVVAEEKRLIEAEQAHSVLEAEIEKAHGDIKRDSDEGDLISAKMGELERSRAELESRIATIDADRAREELELKTAENSLQELKVHEASLRERVFSLKRAMESAQSIVLDRQRRLDELERALGRTTKEQAQYSGGDQGIQQKLAEIVTELGQMQSELSTVRDRAEQSGAKISSSLERIKELHKSGDDKSVHLSQLAIESERWSGELSFLIQNVDEKYGPSCLELPVPSPFQEEMPAPIVTLEMSVEEEKILNEEVEKLRERIRRLGEVNTEAINEYDGLKSRFDRLASEKADLERSITDLKDAIEYINKTSEERFRKAFDAISDRFEKLFPIIFGGGQAKLSLVYPENSTDILEAGVDIMAQPPGKKIANITLLSGGEKALTAVSLIFAIFMVKPSPFCVLDEVDAPLDDANIGKFNTLLREMARKSQFILITHNKKTMELNDTLYGVTMEEPGVSKMVSIEMK